MQQATDNCPMFGIGQIQGVYEYVQAELPRFCERVRVCQTQTVRLRALVENSYHAAVSLMSNSLNTGMVEPTPAGRELYNFMSDTLICPNRSCIASGQRHLETALEFLAQGGNVLLVQNHRSGADNVVTETLVRRLYGKDLAADWAYMAGHAVNLCLVPLMFFASALRRFQIFSVKYKSMGITGMNDQEMIRQNLRAIAALGNYVKPGGKLVALYPEGGRGDHHMIQGQAQTMKVPEIVTRCSPNGLMILPTYMHGATSILPVARVINEYNEILMRAEQGWGELSIGRPVMWEDLQPTESNVQEVADSLIASGECKTETEARSKARKRILADTVLGLIAYLAPNDEERGPYAQPKMKSLVEALYNV